MMVSRFRDNAGHQVSTTLNHSQHCCLFGIGSRLTGGDAVLPATNESFVNFNVTAKIAVTVHKTHEFTNFMTDAPCGLVGHVELALEFLGRYAMPSGRKQVDRVEPELQGGAGLFKGSARARVDMMPTKFAAKGGTIGQAIIFGRLPTFHAITAAAIAQIHHVQKARVIVGEFLEKLFDTQFLSHAYLLPHSHITPAVYVCRGDKYHNIQWV